jgi:uncharacterized membrane protein
MTNKMRLIFVIATSLSAAFSVLMTTQFAIDTADQLLSAVANVLGLHEAPTLSALVVLVISVLYLYLVLGQRKHSVGEQNNGHRDRQEGLRW